MAIEKCTCSFPLLAATGSASMPQGRRFFLEFFDFPIVFYQCEKFLTVFVEPLRSHCFLSVNDLHRALSRRLSFSTNSFPLLAATGSVSVPQMPCDSVQQGRCVPLWKLKLTAYLFLFLAHAYEEWTNSRIQDHSLRNSKDLYNKGCKNNTRRLGV